MSATPLGLLANLPEPSPPAPPTAADLFPYGPVQRMAFALFTVVLPFFSFYQAITRLHLASEQEPGIGVWLRLLVDPPGSLAFAPLAAIVMATCAAVAIRPGSWVASGPCRTVLMLGVALGLQYAVLLPAAAFVDEPWRTGRFGHSAEWLLVGLCMVLNELWLIGAVTSLTFLRRRFGWRGVTFGVALSWLALSLMLTYFEWDFSSDLIEVARRALLGLGWILGFLRLLAAPVWTTDALCRLLYRLWDPRRPWPPGWLALGLALYAASWMMALSNAAAAYQALPVPAP